MRFSSRMNVRSQVTDGKAQILPSMSYFWLVAFGLIRC